LQDTTADGIVVGIVEDMGMDIIIQDIMDIIRDTAADIMVVDSTAKT
jgi:hypothetical protein